MFMMTNIENKHTKFNVNDLIMCCEAMFKLVILFGCSKAKNNTLHNDGLGCLQIICFDDRRRVIYQYQACTRVL